eukprot:gene1767-454_t
MMHAQNRHKRRQNSLDSEESAGIREAILDLVKRRGVASSCCPSEVARTLASSEAAWRALMPKVRKAASDLQEVGVVAMQKGHQVSLMDSALRGPVRLAWRPDTAGPTPASGVLCGLISDTHGTLDPKCLAMLKNLGVGGSGQCERKKRALHAGDVGGSGQCRLQAGQLIKELGSALSCDVVAVRGNVDDRAPLLKSHEVVHLPVGGCSVTLLLVHGDKPRISNPKGKPLVVSSQIHALVSAFAAKIVVFGHSHHPSVDVFDGVMWVNPGSAGPKRFSQPRCCGRLQLHPRLSAANESIKRCCGCQVLCQVEIFDFTTARIVAQSYHNLNYDRTAGPPPA